MRIAVVGAGWFGCHITLDLKNAGVDVSLFESASDVLTGASGNNQNRLHLGFHYPRSYATRIESQRGFYKFIERYPTLSSEIPTNIYGVARRDSLIDFETYTQIMRATDLTFTAISTEDYGLKNLSGAIVCDERLISPPLARSHFRNALSGVLRLRTPVTRVTQDKRAVFVNDESFDFVIDCTWGALSAIPELDFFYEPSVMLVYDGADSHPAITIMDGPFFSIYPFAKGEFVVSSVPHTPLARVDTFKKASQILSLLNSSRIQKLKETIEDQVCYYYPEFSERMSYSHFVTAIKIKLKDRSDSRVVATKGDGRIIHVFSGKIDSIFAATEKVLKWIQIQLTVAR